MMFEEGEYYSPSEMMFSCINTTMSNSKKKKMMMNKRRFSDEQVRSLESIFENETKLEPKKKVQLARELGLQPRQVAIWFQNKRARYKSKQLERDYSILRANYNALASQFDSLKKEKHALFLQVQKLRDLAAKGTDKEEGEKQHHEEEGGEANSNINTKSDESTQIINTHKLISDDHDHDHHHHEANQELSMEGAGSEYGASSILSDVEGSSEIEYTNYNNFETHDDEMDQILKMVDPTVVHQANCNWDDDDLRPDSLFDNQPVDNCQWWDFWS